MTTPVNKRWITTSCQRCILTFQSLRSTHALKIPAVATWRWNVFQMVGCRKYITSMTSAPWRKISTTQIIQAQSSKMAFATNKENITFWQWNGIQNIVHQHIKVTFIPLLTKQQKWFRSKFILKNKTKFWKTWFVWATYSYVGCYQDSQERIWSYQAPTEFGRSLTACATHCLTL